MASPPLDTEYLSSVCHIQWMRTLISVLVRKSISASQKKTKKNNPTQGKKSRKKINKNPLQEKKKSSTGEKKSQAKNPTQNCRGLTTYQNKATGGSMTATGRTSVECEGDFLKW